MNYRQAEYSGASAMRVFEGDCSQHAHTDDVHTGGHAEVRAHGWTHTPTDMHVGERTGGHTGRSTQIPGQEGCAPQSRLTETLEDREGSLEKPLFLCVCSPDATTTNTVWGALADPHPRLAAAPPPRGQRHTHIIK